MLVRVWLVSSAGLVSDEFPRRMRNSRSWRNSSSPCCRRAGAVALQRRFGRDVANQLIVDELLDTHVAELAPVTGILDAAERQFGIGPGNVVDEHHSCFDAAGHALAMGNILGENRAAQSEVGVVGERDRLRLRP